MSDLTALSICVVLAAALEAVAHLLRFRLHIVARYVIGVGIIIAGMAAYALLTADWWPAIVLAAFASGCGVTVGSLYVWDGWRALLLQVQAERIRRQSALNQLEELRKENHDEDEAPHW